MEKSISAIYCTKTVTKVWEMVRYYWSKLTSIPNETHHATTLVLVFLIICNAYFASALKVIDVLKQRGNFFYKYVMKIFFLDQAQ